MDNDHRNFLIAVVALAIGIVIVVRHRDKAAPLSPGLSAVAGNAPVASEPPPPDAAPQDQPVPNYISYNIAPWGVPSPTVFIPNN